MIFKGADNIPEYLFDRSRIECARDCPRKYYWLYGFLGIGIVKVRDIPYWPFLSGTYIHEGVEGCLKGRDIREILDEITANYKEAVIPLLTSPDLQPELVAKLSMEFEQELELVRGLVYGWYLTRYPRILADYTLVEIEKEEEVSWWLTDGEPGDTSTQAKLTLMTRTDILATSKISGNGILFNLKSTKDANDRWRNSFSRDVQTLTEAMAVEERIGTKVDGIIIEGLVKGSAKEWPKGSGFWQYYNSLIYCWVKESTSSSLPGEEGGTEYATSWDYHCSGPHKMGNGAKCPGDRDHTLGKGYRKYLAKDKFPGGTIAWIDYLNRHDPATLESYFVQLPPINRDEFQVERWKRMNLHVEKARQDQAARVDEAFLAGDKASAYQLLDHYFTMHEGWECMSCAYHDICWTGADPFDEDNWKARIPNHLREAQELVKISGVADVK